MKKGSFQIDECFTISGRNYWYLMGVITDGIVGRGMFARSEFGSWPISEIEYARVTSAPNGEKLVLALKYDDQAGLERLKGFFEKDMGIEILD